MTKPRKQVSGSFRIQAGTECFPRMPDLVETSRKQDRSILDALMPDLWARAREQGVTAISGLGLRNGGQRHLGKRIWIR